MLVYGGIFRFSMAAYSVVCGPNWPEFKHIQNSMHFLIIRKLKKDQINSNREKVDTMIFQTQSVFGFGRNSNIIKLL